MVAESEFVALLVGPGLIAISAVDDQAVLLVANEMDAIEIGLNERVLVWTEFGNLHGK